MFLKPEEFYELDIEDYPAMQRAYINRMQTIEAWHRKSAFVIGSAAGAGKVKDYPAFFEAAWPFGDRRTSEAIEDKIVRLRKQGQKDAILLTNNAALIKLQIEQARKKKNGNRRTKNSNRG